MEKPLVTFHSKHLQLEDIWQKKKKIELTYEVVKGEEMTVCELDDLVFLVAKMIYDQMRRASENVNHLKETEQNK